MFHCGLDSALFTCARGLPCSSWIGLQGHGESLAWQARVAELAETWQVGGVGGVKVLESEGHESTSQPSNLPSV